MANLKLELGHEVEIGSIDSSIIVSDTDNKRIGKLVFSKGSLEWWPSKNKINCKTYTWDELAKLLGDNGKPKTVKAKEKKATVK
ncbi:hypothetical protein IM543_02115 [Massilia sp. UMI-21]|nr:hypothetical protein IM543_02115 [Massilia sp. UMI-21]